MKKVIVFALSIFFISCSTMKLDGFKKVSYTSNFQTSSKSNPFEEKTFKLLIPKGFTIEDEDFNSEYKEIVYKYPNSSMIYITDNSLNGSPLNGDNKLNNGIDFVKRNSLNDSIYMKGKQKDGRFWREDILNDIVIGYKNVPEDEKATFDKAISTLSVEKNFESTLQHELIHSKQE